MAAAQPSWPQPTISSRYFSNNIEGLSFLDRLIWSTGDRGKLRFLCRIFRWLDLLIWLLAASIDRGCGGRGCDHAFARTGRRRGIRCGFRSEQAGRQLVALAAYAD